MKRSAVTPRRTTSDGEGSSSSSPEPSPKRARRSFEGAGQRGSVVEGQEESYISPLEGLPVELLWHIHVLSRSPKLPTLNRRLSHIFSRVPNGIKVDYLLASWFDAYRADLVPPGCFARKTSGWCHGPFPPPQSWLNDPISTYERRHPRRPYPFIEHGTSSTAPGVNVIDYCLTFPLCNEGVFLALHDAILRRSHSFSDIISACKCLESGGKVPTILAMPSVPRRLLRAFVSREPNPSDPFFKAFRGLLGGPPYPKDLRFLLRLLAVHSRHSPFGSPLKRDRYALPRATLERSASFMMLLLGLGADPRNDEGMAVRVAIRAGWLEGVRLLIEPGDHSKRALAFLAFVEEGLRSGGWPFHWRDEGANRQPLSWPDDPRSWREEPSSPPFSGHTSFASWLKAGGSPPDEAAAAKRNKRGRIPDRLNPTPQMLHEAVKCEAWDIVSYLRDEKGVVPKLGTLKLLGAG